MAELRFIEDDNIDRIKRKFFNKCKAFLIRNYKPVNETTNRPYTASTYSLFTALQGNLPSRQYNEKNVEKWLNELNFKKTEMPGSASKYWEIKSQHSNKHR